MAAFESLSHALRAVDWKKNVDCFLSDIESGTKLAACNYRLALWASQLEIADSSNPALSFIREMQAQGQYVAALIALGLYKPASSSMRTTFEAALNYTYYRTHHVELATLVAEPKFYMSKTEILEYHSLHSPRFKKAAGKFDIISKVDKWYSTASALIHGQIPGQWLKHRDLSSVTHDKELQDCAVELFVAGEEIVHRLLLATVVDELWGDFSKESKKIITNGLTPEQKQAIGI